VQRPSRFVIGIATAIFALIVTEVIVWWPDPPRKKPDDPSEARGIAVEPPPPEPLPPEPPPPEPPPPESATPTVVAPPPARPGRDIPALIVNPREEIPPQPQQPVEGCRGKRCGDPCLMRCDNPSDGRCVNGMRPGACGQDDECSSVMPAICPTVIPPP